MEGFSYPSPTLETLNISNNQLVSFDVSRMPNLRSLNLDRNAISFIQGVANLKRLDTLSWREQKLTANSGFSEVQYQDCHNVHHLYLSNNILTSFSPACPFLNLRTLEMASTGLQTLPPRFGHKVPNLRFLNLNYNALRDLRPLVGIIRLQTLLLAGNRIGRLRQTTAVFQRVSNELVEVDLRQNPLTVGFYTPQESLGGREKQIALQNTLSASASSRSNTAPEDAPENTNSPDSPDDDKKSSAYVLPPVDPDLDAQSCARLDKDTQLRRRVYEMMIVESCERLRALDGLPVGRKRITEGQDGVRQRLNELGILQIGMAQDQAQAQVPRDQKLRSKQEEKETGKGREVMR
jgi:hypothetical protein